MNTTAKVLIVLSLVVAVGAVMAVKHYNTAPEERPTPAANVPDEQKESKETANPDVTIKVTTPDTEVQVNVAGKMPTPATAEATEQSQGIKEMTSGSPRLVDLGADKCIPCKMMAPILEELKSEYAGQFQVDFFDVWKDPAAAEHYGVKIIPTQIFFDPDGKELFRHIGFFSKEDILGKWNELGVNLVKGANDENN